MAKLSTAAQAAAFWANQADRYEREADKCKSIEAIRHWLDMASEARAKAAEFSQKLPA